MSIPEFIRDDDDEAFKAHCHENINELMRLAYTHGAQKCLEAAVRSNVKTDFFGTIIMTDHAIGRFYLQHRRLYHPEALELALRQILLIISAHRDPSTNDIIHSLLDQAIKGYRFCSRDSERNFFIRFTDYTNDPKDLVRRLSSIAQRTDLIGSTLSLVEWSHRGINNVSRFYAGLRLSRV